MISSLKLSNKKYQDYFCQLTSSKPLILSHGNLFIKPWSISTLDHLSKNGFLFFSRGLNHAFLQNGHMTEYFCLQRDCRQGGGGGGGGLFPHIFLFCVQKFLDI